MLHTTVNHKLTRAPQASRSGPPRKTHLRTRPPALRADQPLLTHFIDPVRNRAPPGSGSGEGERNDIFAPATSTLVTATSAATLAPIRSAHASDGAYTLRGCGHKSDVAKLTAGTWSGGRRAQCKDCVRERRVLRLGHPRGK